MQEWKLASTTAKSFPQNWHIPNYLENLNSFSFYYTYVHIHVENWNWFSITYVPRNFDRLQIQCKTPLKHKIRRSQNWHCPTVSNSVSTSNIDRAWTAWIGQGAQAARAGNRAHKHTSWPTSYPQMRVPRASFCPIYILKVPVWSVLFEQPVLRFPLPP